MVSKLCITNKQDLITVLPCLNRWLLILNSSTTEFLKQSYKEPMCPCILDTGTQALSERFLATFRPLREQRNQPGENQIDKLISTNPIVLPLHIHGLSAKLPEFNYIVLILDKNNQKKPYIPNLSSHKGNQSLIKNE